MAWSFRITRRDAVRASIAGTQGAAAQGAAHVLFEAGGRSVLPASVQRVVRGAVESEASRLLAGVAALEPGVAATARMLDSATVRAVAVQTARAAGRQVLRSVSVAAGAGAALDGGWALVQAIRRVRRGSMTRREAVAYVAREASTGAAATAAGTAAAVLLVTVTGGFAGPAVFLVGAAASVGAKAGLDAWLAARARGAIQAEVAPSVP
jgi:hypothetical protein